MQTCPHCEPGDQGRVVRLGESQKAAYCPNYFDSEGKEHSHNENPITAMYECQQRHRWSERTVAKCFCGWPNAEEEFKAMNPGKRYVAPEKKVAKVEVAAVVKEETVDKQEDAAKID